MGDPTEEFQPTRRQFSFKFRRGKASAEPQQPTDPAAAPTEEPQAPRRSFSWFRRNKVSATPQDPTEPCASIEGQNRIPWGSFVMALAKPSSAAEVHEYLSTM